jgi:hypothetical protein
MWDQSHLIRSSDRHLSCGSVGSPAVLARYSIVARGDIAHPAVGNIKAIDNGEAESPRTLDNATTHFRVYTAHAEQLRGSGLWCRSTFRLS